MCLSVNFNSFFPLLTSLLPSPPPHYSHFSNHCNKNFKGSVRLNRITHFILWLQSQSPLIHTGVEESILNEHQTAVLIGVL